MSRNNAMLLVRPTRACSQSLKRRKEWNGEGGAGVTASRASFSTSARRESRPTVLQINDVLPKKLPLLLTISQYFAKRRRRCIVAKSSSLFCKIS